MSAEIFLDDQSSEDAGDGGSPENHYCYEEHCSCSCCPKVGSRLVIHVLGANFRSSETIARRPAGLPWPRPMSLCAICWVQCLCHALSLWISYSLM